MYLYKSPRYSYPQKQDTDSYHIHKKISNGVFIQSKLNKNITLILITEFMGVNSRNQSREEHNSIIFFFSYKPQLMQWLFYSP